MHYGQWHGSVTAINLALAMATASAAGAQTPGAPTTPAGQGVLARPGTPAVTLLAEAIKAAKASKKPILAYYVGRRAFPDTFVSSAGVGQLLTAHYVVVRLVGYEYNRKKDEEPANPQADSTWVALAQGLPSVTEGMKFLVLDGTGTPLVGLAADGASLMPAPDAFGELLVKTAPGMTAADRKRITDYLTTHGK